MMMMMMMDYQFEETTGDDDEDGDVENMITGIHNCKPVCDHCYTVTLRECDLQLNGNGSSFEIRS